MNFLNEDLQSSSVSLYKHLTVPWHRSWPVPKIHLSIHPYLNYIVGIAHATQPLQLKEHHYISTGTSIYCMEPSLKVMTKVYLTLKTKLGRKIYFETNPNSTCFGCWHPSSGAGTAVITASGSRCDLFSLLHFCRQLYMFRVLTPIIRSWYSCNYSFWYWLTGSTTIRCRWWVATDSCVSYGRYQLLMMGVSTGNM